MVLAIVVGAAPAHAQLEKVKDTAFSHDRGFYSTNFTLTISSATPGASITYTLDGSDPRTSSLTNTDATPVTFTIDPESNYDDKRPTHKNHAPCVLVRAYAHKSGMADTDVDTQTYVFLDKVAAQKDVRPEGNNTSPNWVFWKTTEMDPGLVGSTYSVSQIKEALQDIPTMSVVTDWDELFEDYGMHTGDRLTWSTERPCSIELIYPDLPKYATFDGFQSDALFAIQGAGARGIRGSYDHKQSFNLKWRSEYGPANLNYPLFENAPYNSDTEAGKYHRITLRAGANKNWGSPWDPTHTTYTRDPFVRDIEIAMNGYGSRSTFVHLYLNGVYWGLYNPSEKADLSHHANYRGGNKEDYVYNSGRSGGGGGDTTRYNYWVNNVDNMQSDFSKVSEYVDVNNWIDHMLVYGYANIGDGPQHYWGWGSNPGRGVVFSSWDAEESMGDGNRTGPPNTDYLTIEHITKALTGTFGGSERMRLRFYDRIYKAFYNDGVMTDENVLARWNRWCQFIEKAIIGESCRWGDERETANDPPVDLPTTGKTFTTDDWAAARDGVRGVISGNAAEYVNGFRSQSMSGYPMYPSIDPPLFKNGGTEIKVSKLTVSAGYQLTLENANSGTPGSIKYTVNGQDPYESSSDGGDSTTITINKTTYIRARIQDGATWSACHELALHVNGGQDLSKLKITEIMYNPMHEAKVTGVSLAEVEADDTTQENANEGHPLSRNFENARIRLASASGYSGLTGGDKVLISGNSNPTNNGMHTVEDVEGWDANPKQFGDEIWLTKPLAADGGGGTADILFDGDRYEFIEIKNTGSSTLDLTGCYFSKGVKYRFPAGTQLGAGQFFLLAKNKAHFNSRYPSVTVDGEYDPSNLADAGERLEISSPSGVVTVVSYDNAPPWPVAADGLGKSFVPVSPNPTGSQDDPAQWGASANLNGSPGADDGATQAYPGILINEALTHTDDPLVDQVELYNPTASSVDLAGWHLTDDNNIPDKWTIPSGHVIPAGGYLVFQEGSGYSGGVLQIGPDNFGSVFSLSALGEEVYLISPDYGYGHGFEFKAAYNAALNGTSFGRVTTTGGDDFASQTATSFGSANPGPKIGPVVITEIMYHPANDDPDPANHDHEFVEIKNISAGPVQLYDVANPGNAWKISGAGFTFPTNTEMQSGDIIIVCKDSITPAAFRTKYSVPAGVLIFNYDGKLANGSETVSLEAPDAPVPGGQPNAGEIPWVVIDKVKYDDTAPWPTGAGGPDGDGPSLERINESNYGNDASNWQQSESSGGTPGIAGAPPTTPAIAVSRASVTVTVTQGDNASPELFDVWNSGASTLDYSLSESSSLFSVSPSSSSSTGPGNKTTHTITFSAAAASIGTHEDDITITDGSADNSPMTVTVYVTVDPPPTLYPLTITDGTGDGNYTAGTVVVLTADAPPGGKEFDVWTGDTTGVADVNASTTTITMPAAAATLTATYKDLPPNTYALTVNSGSGDGNHIEGAVVDIVADPALAGKEFDAWTGDTTGVANVNASTTTITMPSTSVTITATYNDLPTSTLTVNSGNGDGSYYEGQVVSIAADAAADGKMFDAWTGDTTGVSDVNDPTTTITMPGAAASVTATYKDAPLFIAYNNMLKDSGNAANVTAHDYTTTNGVLTDYNTGDALPVSMTASATVLDPYNNGTDCTAGTDAANVFGGIVDLGGVAEIDAANYEYLITLDNLNPSQKYAITLTVNRGRYTDQRWTKVTIHGADSYVYASSSGVIKNAEDSATMCAGNNTANGYVVKWTNVTATDGSFSVKSQWDTNYPGSKAYAMACFKLEALGSSGGTPGATPYGIWTSHYFGAETAPSIIGPDVDYDDDGFSNFGEFAFNGDPTDAGNKGQIYVLTADSDFDDPDTERELILTAAVRVNTTDFTEGSPQSTASSADEINYTIEGSGTLADDFNIIVSPAWDPSAPTEPIITGLPALGGDFAAFYKYRSFSLNGSNGLPDRGFLRAKAVSTP